MIKKHVIANVVKQSSNNNKICLYFFHGRLPRRSNDLLAMTTLYQGQFAIKMGILVENRLFSDKIWNEQSIVHCSLFIVRCQSSIGGESKSKFKPQNAKCKTTACRMGNSFAHAVNVTKSQQYGQDPCPSYERIRTKF